MLLNYLKLAIRRFYRNRLFTIINICGLAIGFAICMVILLWVERELSYDRFHRNAQRIYRVERELLRDQVSSRWPIVSGAYRQALIDDYPEIENAVRFWSREFAVCDLQNVIHHQSAFAVDNSVFQIFDFRLAEGDQNSALTQPMSVVLTRELALKYLGTEKVTGQSLRIEWKGESVSFQVTGLLKEVPSNSHLHFDMLISISSYPAETFEDWRTNNLFTYILVAENALATQLEKKLKMFVSQRLEACYGDLLCQGLDIHQVLKIHLFPLTDIHLHPSSNWEIGDSGSSATVYIFISIALLILIIACLNFINLSTAAASQRIKENGLRKTIGARSGQLRLQFILESVIIAIIAFLLAFELISFFLPLYNSVFDDTLDMTVMGSLSRLSGIFGFVIVVGLLAGLYPAIYVTRTDPVTALKMAFRGQAKPTFRRTMVIIQFIISITLISGTLIISRQMHYVQTHSLGFAKDNIMLVPCRGEQIARSYTNFRAALLSHPLIQSLTVSSDVPGVTFYSNTNFILKTEPEKPVSLIIVGTDYDFIQTYQMEIVAGRNFSRDFSSDTPGSVLLNEAAARRFGWTPADAIGKELLFFRGDTGQILGVVKNFNFRSLHYAVEPMAILLYPEYYKAISIRILPGDLTGTLNFIRQKWVDFYPGIDFEFSFLDELLDRLYQNEVRMRNLFSLFSGFSVFVACLGLFGLSVFIAVERTKEIGIRKALGARTTRLVSMLSGELSREVLIANFIAWPVAIFMMNRWLQNFAYRIDLTIGPFLLAGVITYTIALLTISWQAIKAATANPIKSLRYE